MTGDEDLRERFQRARMAERAETPGFRRVLSRRVPAARTRPLATLVVASAIVAMIAVMSSQRSERRGEETMETIDASLGSLRVPSDFLLDVLGSETLRSVPSIGPSDSWFPSMPDLKGTQR